MITTYIKPYLLLFPMLLSLVSCVNKENPTVSNRADYDHYLKAAHTANTSKYFRLWNSKINADSIQLTSFGNVAGEYQRYFSATGQIDYLKKAEKALKKAVEIAAIGKADYYRALARNYIAQHRFREAMELAVSARKFGSGVKESQYLLFDVHLELGEYERAEKYLDSIKNFSDFGYLIRVSKWNDHIGRLETTIAFMEKAVQRAESSKNKDLMLWSYTNLADYYGHAGRIGDSYAYYLKALSLDPANAYAKKGIAWIVFSYEKNPEEALRILDSVTDNYQAPDYYLLKAEIADYLGDHPKRLYNLDQYFKEVKNPAYGDMYNSHNIGLYLEETLQYDRALLLAQEEVANRPTPESYSLLAFCFYKKGEKEMAASIVKKHIAGKTFEPAILLRVAEIYKAGGDDEKAKILKSELLGAVYELGPSSVNKINNL